MRAAMQLDCMTSSPDNWIEGLPSSTHCMIGFVSVHLHVYPYKTIHLGCTCRHECTRSLRVVVLYSPLFKMTAKEEVLEGLLLKTMEQCAMLKLKLQDMENMSTHIPCHTGSSFPDDQPIKKQRKRKILPVASDQHSKEDPLDFLMH